MHSAANNRENRPGPALTGAWAAPAARALLGALALLAAAGCGNYSNDDIAFLAALPAAEQLHFDVPQPKAQALCQLGEASAFTDARQTSTNINTAIDGILALVDAVRGISPTTRAPDQRTWGPWPDDQHPGVELEVIMERIPGVGAAADAYNYAIEGRRDRGPWSSLLDGTFNGASARDGSGALELHLGAFWTLGINKPTDPKGTAAIFYAAGSDPRTVELQLFDNGFNLAGGFGYSFEGHLDGRTAFTFLATDTNRTTFTIEAKFSKAGAGKAVVGFITQGGFSGSLHECWDDLACLSFLDDPLAITPLCNGLRPCLRGVQSACPTGL